MKNTSKLLLGMVLMGLCSMPMSAKVKLTHIMSDNMVLQQQTEVNLWGSAKPRSTVKVTTSWDGQTYTTKADKDGKFLVKAATPTATFEPQTVTFSDGDGEEVILKNVLIGEVWLASGQSNMQMPLRGFDTCPTEGGVDAAISAHKQSGVRFFLVPRIQKMTPQEDVDATWQMPTTANALQWSAAAYFFASQLSDALNAPVGVLNSAYGGTKVEGWTNREILSTYPDVDLDSVAIEKLNHMRRPMVMYNAMLYPLKNYTIKGAIWYQGESNVGVQSTPLYAQRLATMVKLWRDLWGQGEFPFFMAEIAPYVYGGDQVGISAYLREAQVKSTELIPNSGIVSTNDLIEKYEDTNIHPRKKREVGSRFCYMALNKVYGMTSVPCESLRYKSMKVDGSKVELTVEGQGTRLSCNSGLEGFVVAGEDKVFYPATTAYVRGGNNIIVESADVKKPVAVRYCFHDFVSGTVKGSNELPLLPFRTDNWEMSPTVEKR